MLNPFSFLVGVLAWFALILQLVLHLRGSVAMGNSVGVALLNFFSYFTILSNILVALALTAPKICSTSTIGRFFARPAVMHGVAVCIAIVALVYNTVLRTIWDPQGWQLVADNLLHVVVPALFLIVWFFTVPGKSWSWSAMGRGAVFPLVYLGLSLARGAMDGWYPYPFLNVDVLGWSRTLLNSAGVMILFTIVALVLFTLNRLTPTRPRHSKP